jgi:NAD(P)-dependent dehydrogenase (short-subunit alcohol dehydrogenase family)
MYKGINLKDKVILITGGYGYLGKAIVVGLLSNGAKVFVLGRKIENFQREFEHYNKDENLLFEYCDVADSESLKQSFEKIHQLNTIDVLINNAFYSKGQSPEQMTDEDWAHGIDGTLNSVFRSIREIIPYFIENKAGKIINVSSMYGVVAPQFDIYDETPEFLNPPHYGAAKAGVIQLTKYYASYLGKYGINVNAISPGPFPSTNVQKEKEFIEELKKKTCLNRIGKPEDLQGAFVFLASNASDFITGHNLVVDGGWTIK